MHMLCVMFMFMFMFMFIMFMYVHGCYVCVCDLLWAMQRLLLILTFFVLATVPVWRLVKHLMLLRESFCDGCRTAGRKEHIIG